jgi:hypothetical protein
MNIPTVSADDLAMCRRVVNDTKSSASARAHATRVLANVAEIERLVDADDPRLADGRRMSEAMGVASSPQATTGVVRSQGGHVSEFVPMTPEAAAKRLRELEGR